MIEWSGVAFEAPCSIRTGEIERDRYVNVEWKHVFLGAGTGGWVESGGLASR